MAAITAQLVAQLREKTGLGMMECKKALTETEGDFDAAVEMLRKKGVKEKPDRVAGEGLILSFVSADASVGALVELNSETDFVARNDDFKALGRYLAEKAANSTALTVEELLASDSSIQTEIDEARKRIGEKIDFGRFIRFNAAPGHTVTGYVYTTSGSGADGGKIGVLVETSGANTAELGRDVAMHISFAKPKFLHEGEVDPTLLAKEREIITAQTAADPRLVGKPEAAINSAVEGRIRKFLGEIVLLNQGHVRDEKKTISALVKETPGAAIVRYARFEVGENVAKPAAE